MKFTASHTKLAAALELIARLPGSKGTIIPATLKADIGGVAVYRRTPFAIATIPIEDAEIEEEGEVEVFPDHLARIVSRLGTKKAPIEITADEKGILIKGVGTAKIIAIQGDAPAEEPPDGEEAVLKIKNEDLLAALRDTIPLCDNSARDNINGVLFINDFGGLCLLGSNGQHFHRIQIAKKYAGPRVILPPDAAAFLRATLETCEAEARIKLSVAKNYLKAEVADIKVRLGLAAGEPCAFPPELVKQWCAKSQAIVDLDQEELTDALDRLTPLAVANDEATHKLSMVRSGNSFRLETPGKAFNADLEIPCEGRLFEEKVWINASYLRDAVGVFKGETGRLTLDYLAGDFVFRIERGDRAATIAVLHIA